MKNITILALCAILIIPVLIFPPGANGAPAREEAPAREDAPAPENEVEISDVTGKEWILTELRIAGKTTIIDRKKLEADSMGGFFTLMFSEDRISGMGAPNRYFAPYTVLDRKTLNIGLIAGTMMLAFREPEELKENEYFNYLSKVTQLDLHGEKLELYSVDSSEAEVVLVFILN